MINNKLLIALVSLLVLLPGIIAPVVQLQDPYAGSGLVGGYNVNSSQYWDNLDTPADITGYNFWYNHTIFANRSISEVWSYIWYNHTAVSGGNSSWNETHADTLYSNLTNIVNHPHQDVQTTASPSFAGLSLPADNAKLYFGAGDDMALYFDGDIGHLDMGSNNLAIGEGALAAAQATADFNIAIGQGALNDVTSGDSNVAIGDDAFSKVTTASSNLGLGKSAGYYIKGANNVFIGTNAGYGQYNSDATFNIGVGAETLYSLRTGPQGNVAIGYQAGKGVTTGDNNVFIGRHAGQTQVTTENNKLYISNSDTATPLIYGEFDNGKVEINGNLDVNGTTNITGDLTVDTNTLHVDSTNNRVGIGTASPTHPLTIVGNNTGVSVWVDSNVSASGYITRTSIFDKSQSVWDYIKDATYYLTNNEINHTKFYGFTEYETTDFDRQKIISEVNQNCSEVYNEETNPIEDVCNPYNYDVVTYPYTKMEQGVSLDKEIDVLRQAVYELKTENDLIKSELCKKDNSYSWCK